jgi:hypothetical protein
MSESKITDTKTKAPEQRDVEHGNQVTLDDDGSSLGKGDILSQEHTDPVLNAKMHLVNNVSATRYGWKKYVEMDKVEGITSSISHRMVLANPRDTDYR